MSFMSAVIQKQVLASTGSAAVKFRAINYFSISQCATGLARESRDADGQPQSVIYSTSTPISQCPYLK